MNVNRTYSAIFLIGMICALTLGCATPKIVGGPIPVNSLKDGTYIGQAKDGPVKVIAEVTIQNQRVKNINLIEHRTWKGKRAENTIPGRIIDEQSTRVDAVSGATLSSRAIMLLRPLFEKQNNQGGYHEKGMFNSVCNRNNFFNIHHGICIRYFSRIFFGMTICPLDVTFKVSTCIEKSFFIKF
jgi:uncharacterized protein with FMN-binding domain